MNIIEKKYNELSNEYGKDRILCVAATGNATYNQDLLPDVPISVIYLPTEEELYNIIDRKGMIDIRYLFNLATVKNSNLLDLILTPHKIINKKYEKYINDEFFAYLKLVFIKNDEIAGKEIKNIVKELMINTYKGENFQEKKLFTELSNTELKVLNIILEEFGEYSEGDIKISQAVEKYKISTSVFRTLFYKLKENGAAEVVGRGAKGTYIKFNDISTIKSLIEKYYN